MYRGLRRVRFEAYFILMPLHAWMIRGRSTRRFYKELKSSESSSKSELLANQERRLNEIIMHAYNTTDFYKARFDSLGIDPTTIISVEKLTELPLLTKNDVSENLDSGLISRVINPKHMLRINTSGSTGRPFTIYANREQLEIRFASTIRSLEWTGWKFGDKQARLWHQTIGMSFTQATRERIDAWFMKRMFIPAFEISPKNIELFIEKIRKHKPVLIDGYAESLNFLATYIKSGGEANFSPVAIMSSAQALPIKTREIIEEGFGTQVFDKYGSREFSGIAYECTAHGGHHVVDECYIVEILVDGRKAIPGEVGEVVITDLFNRATPMIRYRIGDLAVALDNSVECECGLSHSRIGDIEGRTQAIVHCADGTWLPGTFFAHFFKDYENTIKLFQIKQSVKGSFTLKIVKSAGHSSQEMLKVIRSLEKYTGDTQIDVEYVEEIPLVRTGKRSPVVSDISEDFQTVPISSQIRKRE